MAKQYSRTVKVFIDGSEIENTLPSIQKKIRELTRDIKKMTIGTKEYDDTAKSIADLNKILADHRKAIRATSEEAQSLGSVLDKGADLFNKWYYAGLTAFSSVSRAYDSIHKYIDDYAQMEESMANVRKYTGQSDEEVHQMNEDFKRMDTRTAREQLNELAGAAGRLGITNKEMIEEFVDGADKINVALGDDLGEGAVDKIGKLAHMFGEDDKKGLRGAMLATGSAVNELAQSSSANAGYIVDFTASLSGVAIQAGFSQSQIMGLASALDQNMQEEATASTVFSQLITKMYQEPARFAALAGKDVKDFTNLLKNDANAALLQFLSAMNAQGGFDKMAPMFEEMKLDGTRAVGVLSSVASHLDQVREAQEIASDAYNEGTSVLDEFNVQNNTVLAGMEKAKKRLRDVSVELGERLMPLVNVGIGVGSAAVSVLSAIVTVFLKFNTTILTATALLAAYIVLEKADVAIKKLQVLWNDKVIVGFNKLKAVMMENPWTAAATAILVAIAVIKDWIDNVNEASEAEKALAEVHKDANAQAESEKANLMALVAIARSKTASDAERKAAIEELNKISPEYLGWLRLENINTQKATSAINAYTESIYLNARAKALQAKIEDIEKRKLDEQKKDQTRWYDFFQTGTNSMLNYIEKGKNAMQTLLSHGSGGGWNETTALEQHGYAFNTAEAAVIRYKNSINSLNNEERQYVRSLQQTQAELLKLKAKHDAGGEEEQVKPGKYSDPKEAEKATRKRAAAARKVEVEARRKMNAELDKISAEYENKRSETKIKYLEGEIETEQEYNRKIEDLELEELNRKLDVANLEPKKKAEIQQKILELKMRLFEKMKELDKQYDTTEEERHSNELAALKEQYDNDLALLENAYDKKLISEETYQEKLKKLKEKYDADTRKADKESAERIIKEAKEKFDALLDAQERANIKAGKLDELSQEERARKWKDYLETLIDDMELNAEQRKEIQEELDKAETDITRKGLEERQELENKYKDIIYDTIVQSGQLIGETIGNLLSGQSAAFKDFLKQMLTIMIDAVEKAILAAKAASLAKNISTLGFAGVAKAAAEIALITAAFEAAKTAIGNFAVGGFTSSGPWDKPQGIVHSNEFVANRFATANPDIMPVLSLIDAAQRSGNVSRLTGADIAAVVPPSRGAAASFIRASASGSSAAATPGDEGLLAVLARVVKSLDVIDRRFSEPIVAETYATGRHGTIEAEKLVDKMMYNVKRRRR